MVEWLDGADQRFRGNAADIDTRSAERAAADERDSRSEFRGANRCSEARRAGTDYGQVQSFALVYALRRLRVRHIERLEPLGMLARPAGYANHAGSS